MKKQIKYQPPNYEAFTISLMVLEWIKLSSFRLVLGRSKLDQNPPFFFLSLSLSTLLFILGTKAKDLLLVSTFLPLNKKDTEVVERCIVGDEQEEAEEEE